MPEFAQHRGQRGPIHALHDDEGQIRRVVAGNLPVVENRDHAGMTDGPSGARLASQALAEEVVVSKLGTQKLDRNASPQHVVDSTPDVAHSPAGNAIDESITLRDDESRSRLHRRF